METLKTCQTTQPGTTIPKTKPLFPRVEQKNSKAIENQSGSRDNKPAYKPEITFDDFGKLDLRVATVVRAEAVPKSKKLLKLDVDVGEERIIVAGIAESYDPGELVGKQVIVVVNLKPAKLMGVTSRGMMLAAVDDGIATVATIDREIKPGTPVR